MNDGGDMKSELEELLYEVKSSQEKLIIEVLMEYFERLPMMKLEEISSLCYCSKTSVRRIIIKLGYKGFLEYQLHVKLELSKSEDVEEQIVMIRDSEEIMRMLSFIKEKDHVFVYGKGASSLSAQYLFRTLIEHNYTAVWINEQDLLYNLESENVIVLSNSGKTTSVVKVVNDLRGEKHCRIAAITRYGSELASLSDIALVHNLENSSSRNDQIDSFNTINKLAKVL